MIFNLTPFQFLSVLSRNGRDLFPVYDTAFPTL